MAFILKAVGLVFLAAAAFKGLIQVNLPIEFLAAGLFLWFLADFLGGWPKRA